MKSLIILFLSAFVFQSAHAGLLNSTQIAEQISQESQSSAHFVSPQEALKQDLAVLKLFKVTAHSNQNEVEKTRRLNSLIAWARAETENQVLLGKMDPIFLYVNAKLDSAQQLVDSKNFVEAAQYLDSHVTEVVSLLASLF